MGEFDADGLLVCKYQASIFERSLIKTECGSAVFIRRFMNSDVAAHLDMSTFANEATAPDEAFDLIDKQYGPSTYGGERYSADELYWMGYLYRYWAYVYGTRSSNIYKKIGARDLRTLYPAYHTLDPAQAIERIAEARGVLVGPFNVGRASGVAKANPRETRQAQDRLERRRLIGRLESCISR